MCHNEYLCHKETTEEDIMDTISLSENDRNRKKHSKTQQLENITASDNSEETFPWLLEFNKSVCSSAGNRNYQHLKRLLLFYTQNILSSIETSNVKFDDEINLKDNINNILIFFHLYWPDIKQEIADHSLYLNKMSALLSVYINMELRISRKKNVKILAALYTYLNNSEEHIFRVLLRIKHMTKKCTQICNRIFAKSFANLKIKGTSLTDVTYIRYLLVFKMWKKIEKLSDKKEKVDELALKLLGPHMPKLRDELLEFVPRPPPIDRKDETLWLLQSNSFNLKQVHKNFLLFEDKMDEHFPLCEDQIDKHSLLPEDRIDNSADLQCTKAVYLGQKNCLKSQKYEFLKQMDLLHRSNPNRSNLTSNQEKNKDLNNLQNNNMPLGIKRKSSEQIYLPKKKKRGLKSKKVKKKKEEESRKVIINDITGDVPCKRKKTKHNLKFLKIMKDIIKNKKHINTLKHSSKFTTSVNTEKSSTEKTASNRESLLDEVESTAVDNALNKEKLAVSTIAVETFATTVINNPEVSRNNAIESERLQLCVIENIEKPKEPESQDEYVSERHGIANNTISLSITNGDHSNVQTDLEVGTCIEVSDNLRNSKIPNHKIRETIFENSTADKKNISNIFNTSLCSKNERVNDRKDIDLKTDREDEEFESKGNYNKEHNVEELKRSSVLRTKVDKKDLHNLDYMHDHKLLNRFYEIHTHTKSIQNSSEDKCIIQDSKLQDNMDRLSLLANVIASQHVSHLKAELQCKQIKVNDYASLRNSSYNQTTDDKVHTNDSSNIVSQILENPTADVINKMVGICPEDALNKVALHVEVTSTTDINPDDRGNDPNNNSVPRTVETTINYKTDMLPNNLNIVENNVQSIKENTNVILNEETVMLLQKSPNSNLYIINKAVENTRDHNSDDENCPVKEKSWMIPPEDCTSFEVVNTSKRISFNLDLPQYGEELSCQENKFSVSRNKGIKIEPEEESNLMNITEMKSYGKKNSLSADVTLPATSQIYQDTNVANVSISSKSIDKRKSKSILTYRQNIKQEFSNHITANGEIQGCNGIHTHPHEVIDLQHSLHIPVTHPTTISSIYGNCAADTNLCMPYHKHCTSVSCSLQINSTTSLHSHTKSANACGRSHCSCLNCTYDIVAHCRQCIHPATDSHVSCLESNSYFLPAHSSIQTFAVQEHDKTTSEAAVSEFYDDQILRKIEQRVSLQNNTLEKLDVQREPDKLFKKDMENKLPLKKRLKAHAMMSMVYEKIPIKTEKLDNYPAIPMMSIAALEALNSSQKHPAQIIKSLYELSPTEEEANSHGSCHFNSNIVRRDYCKDIHISNAHRNLVKESTRNHERQFRPNGDQSNTVCIERCQNRTFKTSMQRRDVTATNPIFLKRITTETMEQDSTCKKAKKCSHLLDKREAQRETFLR